MAGTKAQESMAQCRNWKRCCDGSKFYGGKRGDRSEPDNIAEFRAS